MSYVLSEKMKKQLQKMKKFVGEQDQDFIVVVTGYEGLGKSTLALEMCNEWDPEFSEQKITFHPKNFRKTVINSKFPDAVMLDEGAFSFFSRNAMSGDVKKNVQLLTACRKYNLMIIICVPDFFILDKYLREHRVRAVVRVTKRGRFQVFNFKNLQRIEKKKGKIKYPKASFAGSFGKMTGEIWKRYNAKKDRALLESEEVDKKKRRPTKRDLIEKYLKKDPEVSNRVLASVFDTPLRYIQQIRSETSLTTSPRLSMSREANSE